MNLKIILADDHQLFIDGIKSILSSEIGISIIGEANNGLQLLKLLENEIKPDVILTDIRMPVVDGISATRAIATRYPAIPVLALSMYDQPSDISEMLEAGAKGYLIKNAGKREMIDAIFALGNGNEYYSKDLEPIVSQYLNEKIPIEKKPPLSRREKEIIRLIAKGRTSVQIARELNISKLTVDTHRKNILKKLNLRNVTALIKYAIEYEK